MQRTKRTALAGAVLILAPLLLPASGFRADAGETGAAVSSQTPTSTGYWTVAADGGVFTFGALGYHGSMGGRPLNQPIIGMASTPSADGYWLAASDGGIFAFGDAGFFGSAGDLPLARPVVAIASTPSGRGYWMVASDGGVFAYGDAPFKGSAAGVPLRKPIVAMGTTPSGQGYWLVASDGGVFSYGDAAFHGSTGGIALRSPIVAMAVAPGGRGYWLAAADGGVFAFGNAPFRGAAAGSPLSRPIVAAASTPRGTGYWLVAADGGIFSYGDAHFHGSVGGTPLAAPMVAVSSPPVRLGPEVAIFYYPWWGDETWGYRHWEAYGHDAPLDLAADYMPSRGLYGSHDPAVVDAQMAEIAAAGVNTLVYSWWGRGSWEDKWLVMTLAAARAHGLSLALHIEPYGGRSPTSVANDLAFARDLGIRDAWIYLANGPTAAAWSAAIWPYNDMRVMAETGSLASMLNGSFAEYARASGFDGIYTYDPVRFGVIAFATACGQARQRRLLCSASVAPGQLAARSLPTRRTVDREGGARYDRQWGEALDANTDIVSITSYNEWHEGTQIEGVVPHCFPDGTCSAGYWGHYGTTGDEAIAAYLSRTRFWSDVYRTVWSS